MFLLFTVAIKKRLFAVVHHVWRDLELHLFYWNSRDIFDFVFVLICHWVLDICTWPTGVLYFTPLPPLPLILVLPDMVWFDGELRVEPQLGWKSSTVSPSPRLGFAPHPKLQLLLSRERVKLYGLQIWSVHSEGPSKQKPIKIFGEKERGCIQGLPNFLGYPLLYRNGKSYGFQIWPVHSEQSH